MSIRLGLTMAALLVAPGTSAQERDSRMDCGDDWAGWRDGRGARVCAIRELTIPRPAALAVDAGPNGSIRVTGDNRRDVGVRAQVQAWGRDDEEAARVASEVVIHTDGTLRAEGPDQSGRVGWSVSYDVLAPREIDLALEAHNGSIAVGDVRGELALRTHNGGISLDGVAGDVRGRTTNGGVTATLTGEAWEGAGLDLETTNGGVRLRVPEDYSARLETRTINGGVNIDFPVLVQGRIGREISTTLGDGGALVRAETTNGHVRISRR
jgi:hypothetical protein